MEARLAKVRIVGLRYDGGEIHVGNQEFDLTIPGKVHHIPTHALYSLRNGGGKGVFLQNLFQPLDPLVVWNSEDKHVGNTVYHYFYNSDGQPIDYTYHVIEEWQISASKKMMIGISIRPTINRRENSQSAIDLSYLLFQHFYPVDSDLDIFEFPLWDEEAYEALPLEEWKRTLSQSYPDIQTFTMHNRKVYEDILEENGFNKHAISTYVSINSQEGNINGFYKGASDNDGLMGELLIPALNDKIEGIDSRNKHEISTITKTFVETMKVAKELPELLATLQAIEEMHDHMAPLEDLFQDLKKAADRLEEQENKGKHIMSLLNHMQMTKKNLIQKKESECEEIEKEIDKCEWQKENLQYVELYQQLNKNEEDYEELENQKQKIDLHLIKLGQKLVEANKQVFLKKYYDLQERLKEVTTNLAIIENDNDFKNIKKKIQEISSYFAKAWDNIERNWQATMTEYHRSREVHQEEMASYKEDMKKLEGEKNKLTYSKMKYEEELDRFKEAEKEKVTKYGEEVLVFLDDLISKAEDRQSDCERDLTEAIEKGRQGEVKLHECQLSLKAVETNMTHLTRKREEQESQLQKAKEAEEKLLVSISAITKEKLEELPTRIEYEQLKEKVKQVIVKQESALKQKEVDVRMKEEEFFLLKEGQVEGKNDFYIPNMELLQLKRELEEKGFEVLYGAEYLQQFSFEERDLFLKRNPSLPYSVVVINDNLENANFSFLDDKVMRNHVVVVDGIHFSRSEGYQTDNPSLIKISPSNFLPHNKTFDFVTDSYQFNQYKNGIEAEYDNLVFERDELLAISDKNEKVLTSINVLLGNKIAKEMERSLTHLQAELDELQSQKESTEDDIMGATEACAEQKEMIETFRKALEEATDKCEELNSWKQGTLAYEQTSMDLTDVLSKLNQTEKHLTELGEQHQKIEVQSINNHDAYQEWYKNTQSIYATLKSMMPDIQLPQADKTADYDKSLYLNPCRFGNSLPPDDAIKLSNYRELLEERGNRHSRIGKYQSDLEKLQDDMVKLEAEMTEAGLTNWNDDDCPSDVLMVLTAAVQALEKELKSSEAAQHNVEIDLRHNTERRKEIVSLLQKKKEELEKDYPEYGAVYIEIEDIEQEKLKVKTLFKQYRLSKKEKEKEMESLRKEAAEAERIYVALETCQIQEDERVQTLTQQEVTELQEAPGTFHEEWYSHYDTARRKVSNMEEEGGNLIERIRSHAETSEKIPAKYKVHLIGLLESFLKGLVGSSKEKNYEQSIEILKNYFKWSEHNLRSEKEQKEKAETTVNMWVDRASKRMFAMLDGFQDMEKNMQIKNWKGVLFPLVKFVHEDAFSIEKEEVRYKVRDFCLSTIDILVKQEEDVNNLDIRKVAKRVNAAKILLHVVGEYPRLKVYIPTIDGPLLRGEPLRSHFKDWEALNNGSETSPTKSGGQTLLAQFIVMSMILRQRSASNDSWLFLVSDNPFGKMSAPELVEAVFSLLELLKIQWLVVAPPITNVHISSKFNTVFQMDIGVDEGKKVLSKKLMKRKRKYLEEIKILDEKNAN